MNRIIFQPSRAAAGNTYQLSIKEHAVENARGESKELSITCKSSDGSFKPIFSNPLQLTDHLQNLPATVRVKFSKVHKIFHVNIDQLHHCLTLLGADDLSREQLQSQNPKEVRETLRTNIEQYFNTENKRQKPQATQNNISSYIEGLNSIQRKINKIESIQAKPKTPLFTSESKAKLRLQAIKTSALNALAKQSIKGAIWVKPNELN